MKVDTIFLYESDSAVDRQVDEIESAYKEIELLALAFRTRDFGVLINKRGQVLDRADITKIRAFIRNVVYFNPLFNNEDGTGNKKLKNFGRIVAHSFEMTAMAALAAAGLVITGGGIVAGSSLAMAGGSALTSFGGVLAVNQASTLQGLRSASRILNISDALARIRNGSYRPSAFRQFMNKLRGRSKAKIEEDVRRRVERNVMKAKRELENLIADLPDTINYRDDDGELKTIHIETLFDV